MKRKGQVLNRADIRAARRSIQWAAKGCHWGEGPYKWRLIAAAKALLARGPAYLQQWQDARRGFDHTSTQSSVTYFVFAGAGENWAETLRQEAQEREDERPQWANWTYDDQTQWTYDDQTQWHWDVADVCDKIADL